MPPAGLVIYLNGQRAFAYVIAAFDMCYAEQIAHSTVFKTGAQQGNPMDKKTQINFWYVIIAILGVLLVQNLYTQYTKVEPIPYSRFHTFRQPDLYPDCLTSCLPKNSYKSM